ncbi:peptidoglycan DD-metalloendopeptidase family protein [Altererythrobacter aurantiacus]|uniref:Peptidoglycan DD-metalloendopeptidase family protein n=2 Tax=Parapontixanthobacter aurantiacus TaxID=1463599 RepID=A0A844ZGC9_9SPHN|nr:peptidoglycan DD-metalloendopeptidase family protein [Parapontixanthobacter aurantiacus]
MVALIAVSVALWPEFAPLEAATIAELDEETHDEFRSQMIMPLALGGDTGRRMAATDAVRLLRAAPERPQLQLLATYGQGDSLTSMLRRSGLEPFQAAEVEAMIGRAFPLEDIEPGTQFAITLGRRPAADEPRPLDNLSFRARFDLEMALNRTDGQLAVEKQVIRVDDTPLRIRGEVGGSLYRSARAAGAPASAIQAYLKAMGDHMDLGSIGSSDTFDMILSYRRAETGERQAGKLLFAGIERGGQAKAQLMRFGDKDEFFDASGTGEQRSGLIAPVPGSMSSRYGMRRHPILGYKRMHAGLDFRGRHGTPIVAVTDGTVSGAGRMGGCGIAVRLNHAGGLSTRYCHMSRMAVSRGQRVRRGQVIGYIGSTGLSTGPHLHYEMYRGNRHVDPASVKYVTRQQLTRAQLAQFRENLARLKRVAPGEALAELAPQTDEAPKPMREIDRLNQNQVQRVD